MFHGIICGLIMALAIPSIRRILIATNQSSTPKSSYHRYFRIFLHIRALQDFDFETNPKAWKSVCMINKVHRISSKASDNLNCGRINQKDMAMMQFAFMGLITLKSKLLGITTTNEYLESMIHFWRTIGYLMGMNDKYNLCTDSWETTKPRLEILLHKLYEPYLKTLDEEFLSLARNVISALRCSNPFLTFDAFLYFIKRLAGCPGYEYLKSDYKDHVIEKESPKLYKKLSLYNRYILFLLVSIHQHFYKNTICRWYWNLRFRFAMFLHYYFPFIAFFRFGFKDAYVRIEN